MKDTRSRSPLFGKQLISADKVISLQENPDLSLLLLRGTQEKLDEAARLFFDINLPSKVGMTSLGNLVEVMWISPDEWLLVTKNNNPEDIRRCFTTELQNTHHQIVDVSDAYAIIELAGTEKRNLLSKLITIDLHPREFMPEKAVATTLAKSNVWIWLKSNTENYDNEFFRIFVRRSHAEYVWRLLVDAGRELS